MNDVVYTFSQGIQERRVTLPSDSLTFTGSPCAIPDDLRWLFSDRSREITLALAWKGKENPSV